MKYPLIFYTGFGVPKGAAASARSMFIFIRPKYKGDEGLYQHELMHIKQWFCLPFIHPLLYLLVPRYKFWCEVQAYRKQLTYYPDDRALKFAGFLSRNYGLDISFAEALEKLRD